MQIGIKKAVKMTKNNEIPSTTTRKCREEDSEINGSKSTVNWNFAVELSKSTHNINDNRNVTDENNSAVVKIRRRSQLGKKKRTPDPKIGKRIIQ